MTLLLPVTARGDLGEPVGEALGARRGADEHGVGVGRLDNGGYGGHVVGEREGDGKVWGDARPCPYGVLSVAPGSRDCFARMRRRAMKPVPSAPVDSTYMLKVRRTAEGLSENSTRR